MHSPVSDFDDMSDQILKNIRQKNLYSPIIGQLNINSIRNKFSFLDELVKDYLDILLISETKLDDSFTFNQFLLKVFSKACQLDRSSNGGGLLLYIKEDIPSRVLNNFVMPQNMECMFVEINIHKRKWLLCCSYNPNKNNIAGHLHHLKYALESYLTDYDNILVLGDLNSESSEPYLNDFCDAFNLKNLVKSPTCFKNPDNPSCIDLFLTNRPKSFHGTRTLETGLSDFHKMVITILKLHYKKQKPKIIQYRKYKNFSNDSFKSDLNNELLNYNLKNIEYSTFHKICLKVLNKHAPIKQKYIRANNSNFMNKDLRKAIMCRSRLRNAFLKEKSYELRLKYYKQRNLCVSLLRKSKRNFFSNLDLKIVSNNRKFWKATKPLFSEKAFNKESITLIENNEIICNNNDLAHSFNNHFSSVVDNLKLDKTLNDTIEMSSHNDLIYHAIEKYQNHPSIIDIKKYMLTKNLSFSFSYSSIENISNIIHDLNPKKTCQINDVPVRILQGNNDLFSSLILHNFNNSLFHSNFPSALKNADVIPIHKKHDRTDIENYRPISILPSISKVYEKCMNNQIYAYFQHILSKNQCGFRENYNTQHCLLNMIEKWRQAIDKQGSAGALLTDLSKAFDCMLHDLLIAKLAAFGFDNPSLLFIYSYLVGRMQRTKVNNAYSSYSSIQYGVPQGSILGPLLFNIYMCDMFFQNPTCNIASYADDTTPYSFGPNSEIVLNDLKDSGISLFKWFKENHLKFNPDKCHLLLSFNSPIDINIEGTQISKCKEEKLLGIKLDDRLSFENHVISMCKKATQKLHALARIARYMDFEKRKTIMHAFIMSQFNYCPLVWMFYSRKMNNQINSIHERSLRIAYDDKISSFDELLRRDCAVTIHQKNLQYLAIEIFKVKNDLSPDIMKEVFNLVIPSYNLRSTECTFSRNNVRTTHYGLQSLKYLSPKIWELVPDTIKNCSTLQSFKKHIKSWNTNRCPCRLCKTYVARLGFI